MAFNLADGNPVCQRLDDSRLQPVLFPSGRRGVRFTRQYCARALIKIFEQVAFPIAPDCRAYALEIGIGKQKKHIEHVEVADLLRELFGQPWFAEITPL